MEEQIYKDKYYQILKNNIDLEKKVEELNKYKQELADIPNIPNEFLKEINDIMNDSPTLVKIGDSEFKIKRLRLYSKNRIMNLAKSKMLFGDKNDTDSIINYIAHDLDASIEIVAIILCNHYFSPENMNPNSYKEALEIEDNNNKLIYMMKQKIMFAGFSEAELAQIVFEAFNALELESLFMLFSYPKMYSDLASMRKQANAKTYSSIQQAKLGKWGIS